ncbi:MAG TPA: helix-turn-helix transcriptional regulator [Acidimicrobiales bacterium]
MDVATLIARRRQGAGLSQRQLAQRAGTSAAAVCLYEQGARVPRVDTLARLLAATGATLELGATLDPPWIDPVANGRALEDLLDLAEHLPQRAPGELRFPVVRDLVA